MVSGGWNRIIKELLLRFISLILRIHKHSDWFQKVNYHIAGRLTVPISPSKWINLKSVNDEKSKRTKSYINPKQQLKLMRNGIFATNGNNTNEMRYSRCDRPSQRAHGRQRERERKGDEENPVHVPLTTKMKLIRCHFNAWQRDTLHKNSFHENTEISVQCTHTRSLTLAQNKLKN